MPEGSTVFQFDTSREAVSLKRPPAINAKHGGRCAFIGYPVEDGSTGSFFQLAGQCIAMSAACENKEAAWEFMFCRRQGLGRNGGTGSEPGWAVHKRAEVIFRLSLGRILKIPP